VGCLSGWKKRKKNKRNTGSTAVRKSGSRLTTVSKKKKITSLLGKMGENSVQKNHQTKKKNIAIQGSAALD